MASINKQNISGDLDVSRNLATGGALNVTGKAQFGGNVKVEGVLDAPNLKVPFKGVFDSDTELAAAYPGPPNGWYAYAKTVGGETCDAGTYYIMRAYALKWVSTGETGTLEVKIEDDDYNALKSDIDENADDIKELQGIVGSEDGSVEGTLSARVTALEEDVKENHLSHYTENVESLEYDTESGRYTTDTDALLALNKNAKDGRIKLAAESVFVETSDFEINDEEGTITRKDGSPGGSVYITTPNGITERATRIQLQALKRINEADNNAETNGIIQAYTTADDGFTHNGDKVLTTRDLTEVDEKLQKLSDAINDIIGDGESDGDSLSSLRALITLLQDGKWGGSVRFNGLTELGDDTLVEGYFEGESIEGILWLTDRKMFVAVDAEVVVDCGCQKIVYKYYTDWDGSRFFMETPGEEGALWKQKIYIHGGSLYVWKECEGQLVKTSGKFENTLSDEDIDEIMDGFEFVDIGNPIYKVEANGDAQLYLEAEQSGNEVEISGKVDIQDITEQDVEKMFTQAEKELS